MSKKTDGFEIVYRTLRRAEVPETEMPYWPNGSVMVAGVIKTRDGNSVSAKLYVSESLFGDDKFDVENFIKEELLAAAEAFIS